MNFPHPRKKKHNIMTIDKTRPKNTSKDTFKDNRIFFSLRNKKMCASKLFKRRCIPQPNGEWVSCCHADLWSFELTDAEGDFRVGFCSIMYC